MSLNTKLNTDAIENGSITLDKLATTVTDLIANKLPLDGGTISGLLTVKRSPSAILFKNSSDSPLGYLGIHADDDPVAYKADGKTIRHILHSGNYNNYALPLSGGTLTGDLTLSNSALKITNEKYVAFYNPRYTETGKGWAIAQLTFRGPADSNGNTPNIYTLGAYGSNNILDYVYIGANGYSENNLRIYKDGHVRATTFKKIDGTNVCYEGHTQDGSTINKLTGYTKETSASDISQTDTLNSALGKLEYKADTAYDWINTVTAEDTDAKINKWNEIVDFVDSVKEGTDITEEFVTRKTEQTITGLKSFEASSVDANRVGVALKLKNAEWIANMSTAVDFYNGKQYTVPNARIETLMNGAGGRGGTLIFSTQSLHDTANPNPNGLTERFKLSDDGIATFNTAVLPKTNNTYSLGTNANQWNNIYGKTIYEDGTSLVNKYLKLSGGMLTGAIDLTNSPNPDDEYKMGLTLLGSNSGGIHLNRVSSYGNDYGNAITWGYSNNDTAAAAGIYVKTGNSYGTKMYLATTNLFADGPKAALEIDQNGNITALRSKFIGNVTGNVTGTASSSKLLINTLPSSTTGAKLIYTSGQFATSTTPEVDKAYIGSDTAFGILSTPVQDGTTTLQNIMNLRLSYNTSYFHDIATTPNQYTSLWHRGVANGNKTEWKKILDSGNYNTYAAEKEHTHSYLPLAGGTLTGDLSFSTGNEDRFINFNYNGGTTYSWRLGYLGTGEGNTNYFTIQSAKAAGTQWYPVVNFGNETLDASFAGNILPMTTNTKNLGSSNLKWLNVYATTFTGNLTGNADTATKASTVAIEVNSDNVACELWFQDSTRDGSRGKLTYDNDLRYNPSKNTLMIGGMTSSVKAPTTANVVLDGANKKITVGESFIQYNSTTGCLEITA